ncbi:MULTISPECIES: flagellar hook protein FlgE [Pacificimonas]|uniref:flagellar hook protein FlgE n=1 Tax=Pacificimonas TaxID=1960290 RepID=UPI001CCB282F|nr:MULTISPECIES: flagellar hook protein FlgE [Pacificimonas]
MSLYSALYAGVSGLGSNATAMAGVADNITNINTTAYKGVQTQFKTMVAVGNSGTTYSAGGIAAAPQTLISKQGVLQASASSTDLGIDGAGFFVVRQGPEANDSVAYTRAGSFTPDEDGFLRNVGGYYLQGWRLDATGSFVNDGDLGRLEPVRLNELAGTATPTTNVEFRANLDSSSPVFTGAYASGDIASGNVAPQFSRSMDIFDEQGNSHRVSVGFIKTGVNQWAAEIYADPSEVTTPTGVLASGTIAFNPDGSIDAGNTTPALLSPITPPWSNGAGAQAINFDLGTDGEINGLTQFGAESALISSSVNGGMMGTITSVSVSDEGVVSALFDDGSSIPVFQLPIATFPNPDGLSLLNGNAYEVSNDSGSAAINQPGSLGAGSLAAGALEASNVDLAEEFTNMIRFQRAYSASSRIITTVDEMLQEVGNLKR